MSHFGDPTFEYHRALAQVWGALAIALVDSPIIPFNYTYYAETFTQILADLEAALKNQYSSLRPKIDLSVLSKAINNFEVAVKMIDAEIRGVDLSHITALQLRQLNDRLTFVERAFLTDGIVGRKWYKHIIVAPALEDS